MFSGQYIFQINGLTWFYNSGTFLFTIATRTFMSHINSFGHYQLLNLLHNRLPW